jgi:hypothetical protein
VKWVQVKRRGLIYRPGGQPNLAEPISSFTAWMES